MTIAELVYAQVKTLPEPLAQEVLEFVRRLRTRDPLADKDLLAAQQAALAAVWDNDEDRVWDDLESGDLISSVI